MKSNIKTFLTLNIFIILLLSSEDIYATRMPGVWDYAGLISVYGLFAGVILATVAIAIVYLISKRNSKKRKYILIWLLIFIGTPLICLILYFLILLIFSI